MEKRRAGPRRTKEEIIREEHRAEERQSGQRIKGEQRNS